MFYYLHGELAYLVPGLAVLDVGGVGYKLTVSGSTYDALPKSRQDATDVTLFTHMAVREDDVELFGFATETELDVFKLLITVSGIGPKAAMSILSAMTPEQFTLAVCTEDRKSISAANGIGAKTAARIILELRDKMLKESGGVLPDVEPVAAAPASAGHGKLNEALEALITLGYNRSDAMSVIKTLDIENMSLEEIIRASLKKLIR